MTSSKINLFLLRTGSGDEQSLAEQASLSFTRDGAGSGSLLACKRKRHSQREEGEEGIKPRKGELRLSPHPCCCRVLPIPLLQPLGPFFSQNSPSFLPPRSAVLPSMQLPHSFLAPMSTPHQHPPLLHIPFLHPSGPVLLAVTFLPLYRARLSFLSSCRQRAPLSEQPQDSEGAMEQHHK